MPLESATYISDLNASNPLATDGVSVGDDHIRLIKNVTKATFPNVAGAVTPTHTELNYVDGVTSAIQTQLTALSGPLFRAYNSATQVIATGTEQKMVIQTEQYDTATCYDPTTNYRFTPNKAGYYNIRINAACPTSATGFAAAHIYKNGARYAYTQVPANSGGSVTIDVSAIVYFNGSTDYVEAYFGQSSGGNLTLADGGGVVNFFEGVYVHS